MKQTVKLTAIGFIAGCVLIIVLKIVQFFTGNEAYSLLFNFDYIPLIKDLKPVWLYGYIFHFFTCIASVIVLFYILRGIEIERKLTPYLLVYTMGGAGLYFLTSLSEKPPAANDYMAWLWWTLAHALFAFVVGALIKRGC